MDVEIVETSTDRFDAGLEFYKQHTDKQWGFIDCLSFVAMRDAGIEEALTFDEHFVQAGFRAPCAIDPPGPKSPPPQRTTLEGITFAQLAEQLCAEVPLT